MLRLILGEDWISNRDALLEMVAEDVRNNREGSVLLVPEQISHEMERRLCACAGDTASLYAEVLSFTRLASRVFAQTGGGAAKILDAGGRMIAMAAAAEQLRSRLKVFSAVSARPEFLSQMVSAVDEFKSCCVSPESLRFASAQSEGVLAQKLEELSLLLETYDAICAGCGKDPRDRMTMLLEALEDSDFPEKHRFYIDGFSDFTVQEQRILRYLLSSSPEVVVSLVCTEPKDPAQEFSTAGETAFSLLRFAQKAGIETQIVNIPGRHASPLDHIRRRIFSGASHPLERGSEFASAGCFGDIWSECAHAAQQIRRLVREEGARYRDMNLVCADLRSYEPVLRSVMERYEIPVYFSGTENILRKPVISAVLTALEAALSGLEQDSVLLWSRSVLSPLSLEECDDLENYVLLWRISGSQWTEEWTMHPEQLGGAWFARDEDHIRELNSIRRRCVEHLARLRSAILSARNTDDQLRALNSFLENIHAAEKLRDLAEEYAAAGDRRSAQETEQLWDILVNAMEQMDRLLGQTAREPESFFRLFELLLSQYDVGTIPSSLDQVTAGAVADLRRRQASYVFVLGAEEGAFPPYASGSSVLTESERETLHAMGISLSGSFARQMDQELAGIYAAVSAATKRLEFSTGGGQGAYLFQRLCALLGQPGDQAGTCDPIGNTLEAASFFSARGDEAAARSLGILADYHRISRGAGYAFGLIRPETVRGLYGEKLHLSASQIDKLAKCRFAYFMEYGLRVKERQAAEVDPRQFGTFVHYVLEHTARDVESLGGFAKIELEKALEIAQGHMDAYVKENFRELEDRSFRESYLQTRNYEEIRAVVKELWEELRCSDFRPKGFEVGFGPGSDMPAVELKGTHMEAELGGYVDRVDTCTVRGQNYVRVVDYKTGKKNFDYCDILNGIGLQMLLYLFALEAGGADLFGKDLKAAGVLYFPARMPLVTASGRVSQEKAEKELRRELVRKGIVLKDTDVVRAMEDNDPFVYLPCKVNAKGEFTQGAADPAQWEELKDYVYATVGRLIDRVSSGNIEPDPYSRGPGDDACRFCAYGDACHLDVCGGKREFQAVKEPEFWEQIGGKNNG